MDTLKTEGVFYVLYYIEKILRGQQNSYVLCAGRPALWIKRLFKHLNKERKNKNEQV